mgnify:CR=1 FL=1
MGGDKLSDKFSTARTAQILDISTNTLKRWYKWYENESYVKPDGLKLPEPTRDGRGTRFFTMEQVQELRNFQQNLKTIYRGCMSEFNATYQWGNRGTEILMRKKGEENE